MSSAGLFKCRQASCKGAGRFTVQFASPQNAIIAECNAPSSKNPFKCLFLKDLTAVRLLARRLLYRFYKRTFGDSSHEQRPRPRKRNRTGCSRGLSLPPRGQRESGRAHATLPASAESAPM